MQEIRVQSLDREDPLEKGMATHSSILAWRISWTEERGRATVHGVAKSQTGLSKKGLSISIDLVTLDISCEWNHKIGGLLFLAYFTCLLFLRVIYVEARVSTLFLFMAE